MQQKELSVWLRAVVILIFLCCLFLAFIVIPEQSDEYLMRHPDYAPLFLPGLIFFWVTLLPVFASLLLAWRIFAEIGRDNSFCEKNALRLRGISGWHCWTRCCTSSSPWCKPVSVSCIRSLSRCTWP
jgi:hypothetical protein